jgi:hypothetical protein
VELVV